MRISAKASFLRLSVLVAGVMAGALAHAQGSSGCATVAADVTGGSARFQMGNESAQPVRAGRPVPVGSLVATGPATTVALRFSDGQIVALGENTRFRVVNCQFNPKDMDKNGMFLNLIEGSARLVMGEIGQHDPRRIRFQVGTGTVTGAQSTDGTRGGDAGVSVQGAVTLLEVTQGRMTLTLPNGQSLLLAAGQAALVQADGSIRQGSISQVETQASQTATGKLMVSSIDLLESYAFPKRPQQTVIALSTPTTPPTTTPEKPGATSPSETATPPGTTPPGTTPPLASAPPGTEPAPPATPEAFKALLAREYVQVEKQVKGLSIKDL